LADEIISQVGNVAGGFADIGYIVIIVVGVVAIIGMIAYMIYHFLRHKHRFIIRELTSGRKRIFIDKAREWTDKTGVKYWKLLRSRQTVPVPPEDAVELTNKGKLFVEAYRTKNDEYIYIRDVEAVSGVDTNFKPITTNQRAALANQIRKKFDRKTKTWTEYIPIIASGFVLVIVFAMALIFWNDITKPSIEAMKVSAKMQENNIETAKLLQSIINREQVLKDSKDKNMSYPPD
jgi:hypothetical protein